MHFQDGLFSHASNKTKNYVPFFLLEMPAEPIAKAVFFSPVRLHFFQMQKIMLC